MKNIKPEANVGQLNVAMIKMQEGPSDPLLKTFFGTRGRHKCCLTCLRESLLLKERSGKGTTERTLERPASGPRRCFSTLNNLKPRSPDKLHPQIPKGCCSQNCCRWPLRNSRGWERIWKTGNGQYHHDFQREHTEKLEKIQTICLREKLSDYNSSVFVLEMKKKGDQGLGLFRNKKPDNRGIREVADLLLFDTPVPFPRCPGLSLCWIQLARSCSAASASPAHSFSFLPEHSSRRDLPALPLLPARFYSM